MADVSNHLNAAINYTKKAASNLGRLIICNNVEILVAGVEFEPSTFRHISLTNARVSASISFSHKYVGELKNIMTTLIQFSRQDILIKQISNRRRRRYRRYRRYRRRQSPLLLGQLLDLHSPLLLTPNFHQPFSQLESNH